MRKSMMMKVPALVGLAAVLVAGGEPKAQAERTFQLIYHSDTRAYYRPCG